MNKAACRATRRALHLSCWSLESTGTCHKYLAACACISCLILLSNLTRTLHGTSEQAGNVLHVTDGSIQTNNITFYCKQMSLGGIFFTDWCKTKTENSVKASVWGSVKERQMSFHTLLLLSCHICCITECLHKK